MAVTQEVASQSETISAILLESKRPKALPLRGSFLQHAGDNSEEPPPLAHFMRRGRESALDQYLLALTWASGGDHDVRRDSRIWARAVVGREDEAARRTVARNWNLMRELQLVSTKRSGRLTRVTFLQEDGSGQPYGHPGKGKAQYLQLPFVYWEAGWHHKLGLPGKALLLIALSLLDFFRFPAKQGPAWYGISESTVERGLRELRHADLLEARRAGKPAPLAPEGYTLENYYRLAAPFGPKEKLAKGVPKDIKRFLDLPESSKTDSGKPAG
jgi:DNA-binding transcriptional ArsR family regulator